MQKLLFPNAVVRCLEQALGMGAVENPARGAKDEQLMEEFRGQCILLVEDIEVNREIVMAVLEPTGLVVECASDGKQELEMFREHPQRYSLIFMDIHMPEMDGYAATKAIRALDAPQAQAIPIVAMTANAFREDVDKCFAVGMNGHIGKPIDFDEVLDTLRRFLL